MSKEIDLLPPVVASGVRLAKPDFICVSVAWVALVHFPPFWVFVSFLGFLGFALLFTGWHIATSNIGVSGQAMPSPDRVNWQVPRTVGASKPLIGTRPIHERWIDLSGNWGS